MAPKSLRALALATLANLDVQHDAPHDGLCLVCGTFYGMHTPACVVLRWEASVLTTAERAWFRDAPRTDHATRAFL